MKKGGFKMNEGLVVLVRSLVAFISLFIFARFLGKQQLSQLTFFDYVLGITIGSIAASLSVDLSSRAWPHWVGLVTWTVAVFILQWASHKYLILDKYFNDEPTVVIANGKIMENEMKKARYTISDLLEQLREKGVFNLNEVAYAIAETDGKLSVLKKPEHLPASRQDLNLTIPELGISTELIIDGVIIKDNLYNRNLDEKWLDQKLKGQGLASASQVFFMSIDDAGTLYVDRYEDHVQKPWGGEKGK